VSNLKLNSSHTTPSITVQFNSADQSLFRTVLTMLNHVMHRFLPPNQCLQYKLRPQNHNLMLTRKLLQYDSHSLLFECFSGRPIDFHVSVLTLYIMFSVLHRTYMYQCDVTDVINYYSSIYLTATLSAGLCVKMWQYVLITLTTAPHVSEIIIISCALK